MAQFIIAYLDLIAGGLSSVLWASCAAFVASGASLVTSLVVARRVKKLLKFYSVDRQ